MSNLPLIICLSLIPFLLHLYVNAFEGYGYFRDEFYYLACSQNLSAGYVDQPPLSILILKISTVLFGDSVFALRLLPALANALIVFFTCKMVLKFGGSKSALVIASVAVIFAPIYLGMCTIFSMNCFDILLWTVSIYVMILIFNQSQLKYWILLGILMGLGLMNKTGFSWLVIGFFTGLLLTDKRRELLTFKPYLSALIAFVMFTPYIVWNFQNDFAHLEFIRNATSGKYSELTRSDFIKGQFLNLNPVNFIVWFSGIIFFFFTKHGKPFRVAGIIFLTAFTILIVNPHSKAEYLSAAYPPLFAGGGVFIENIIQKKFKFAVYIIVSLIVVTGMVLIPFALPILPVESFIKYSKNLGIQPSTSEDKELSELPQFYADMFGWEELAKEVSRVNMLIPESERQHAVVYGQNYGEAGAIDFYRKQYPLPRAISLHNNYWIWGYGKNKNPVFIIIGGEKVDHENVFDNVVEAGLHKTKYSMPYENNLRIYIARNIKGSADDIWNRNKNYD